VLAPAEAPYRVVVARINHQVKTTQTLNRHDLPAPDQVYRPQQGVEAGGQSLASFIPQLKLRTAIRAGVGLSMKATIVRVFVLTLARLAHLEGFHRGFGPVVGKLFNNAETGPAVGAVGERIAKATIVWIQYLVQAIGAGGDIRED
jgi:hypothetical protein